MKVYQTEDGLYVGEGVADPDPVTPGEWLIPGGAVLEAPPTPPVGKRARWIGDRWKLEDVPPPPTEPVYPPPLKVVTREQLIDRMTNPELTEFLADREAWTARQREKFNSITQVVEGTPAWTLLATKLAAKFGNARALELMA